MGLVQGSPEWLAMRKNYIGASDCSVVMGLNPWRSPYALWCEKLGLTSEPQMNDAMRRGQNLEPVAREKISQELGIKLFPDVKFHPTIPYMMASLDGISEDGQTLIEIKVPGYENHQKAIRGDIPDYYYAQCQHQMEVCGLRKMIYYSFDGNQGVMIEIKRNDKFLQELLDKERIFWDHVINLEPPELTKKDYVERTDEAWTIQAQKYLFVKNQIKDLEELASETKKSLIELSGKCNSQGAGLKLFRAMRRGNIQYSEIPELSQIDLEKYRKPPSESWRIM